jgi:hypothetical protein
MHLNYVNFLLSFLISADRYAKRYTTRKEALQPTPSKQSVETDLQKVLKNIDTTLIKKYDGATRKRIADKIKVIKWLTIIAIYELVYQIIYYKVLIYTDSAPSPFPLHVEIIFGFRWRAGKTGVRSSVS